MNSWAPLIATVTTLVALAAMVLDTLGHRQAGSFPLRALMAQRFPWPVPRGRLVVAAAAGGVASVLAPAAVAAALGWITVTRHAADARWLVLAMLTVTVKTLWVAAEEIVFRGALLSQVAKRAGTALAILVSAVVFAAAHLSRATQPDSVSLAVYTLDGLIFGTLAAHTGTLWAPSAWHLAKNLAVWCLGWGGSLQFASGPMTADLSGPPSWTGAAHQAGRLDVIVTLLLLGVVLARAGTRSALPHDDTTR